MGFRFFFLFIVQLYFCPALAMQDSKTDLFDRLSRAGFQRVVEFPFSNFFNLEKHRPFVMTTGNYDEIETADIAQLNITEVPSLSFKRSKGSRKVHFAYQVGDFLVCYKKGRIRSNGSKRSSDDHFSNCFIFPQQISAVLESLHHLNSGGNV